jgi:hypothetical protein
MKGSKKLFETENRTVLIIDLLMITIVIFNLLWLFFDMAYAFVPFRDFLEVISPRFNNYYGSIIHPRFIVYDIIFVSIYLTELSVRWITAIVKKTYSKWFFYPFIHWYDVLGCLPISGFRMLRLLRVFSMVYRLERLGIINLSDTFLYREFDKYRKILVEEISDRVVINVIDGIQDEIQKDSPVMHKIVGEVLMPRQQMIVDWTSANMALTADRLYSQHKDGLKSYLEDVVNRGLNESKDINRLKMVPGVSKVISDIVKSVSDVTFNLINETVEDIVQQRNKELIENIASDLFKLIQEQSNATTEEFFKSIIHDILEVVKAEVAVKQWQVEEENKKKEKLKERIDEELEQNGHKKNYFN